EENLKALDFDIPIELRDKLDTISDPGLEFPYSFFQPSMQTMLTGGTVVGNKPASYNNDQLINAEPAGVE
ncbi:MAG: aldo/keto reductase, partial [Bacteroidota bacterium]